MSKKQITQEKIIQSFLSSAAEKGAGATSLSDISDMLEIKKASLYNHFASRDDMYNATLEYCSAEILNSTFMPVEIVESAATGKNASKGTALSYFKKAVTQYFKLFECDPFYKMYVFIHSEQYFNRKALDIVQADYKRLSDQLRDALKVFKKAGKCDFEDKELKDICSYLVSVITNQLDLYIARKQEIIRQNPDTGVGSLFALPTDEAQLEANLHIFESSLKKIVVFP